MYGMQQSDGAMVEMKPANKGDKSPAESAEPRAPAESNRQRPGTTRTQSLMAVLPGAAPMRQVTPEFYRHDSSQEQPS